jgi:hypothetical protein
MPLPAEHIGCDEDGFQFWSDGKADGARTNFFWSIDRISDGLPFFIGEKD